MPNVRSDPFRAALVAALVLVVAGCSLVPGDDDADRPAPAAPTYTAPPDLVAGIEQTLQRRATAVLDGDPDAFDRGVAGSEEFRASERTWFGNLRQLPVGELSYVVDPMAMVREGDDYWVVVEEHLLLGGYDAVPVVTRDRYRFREHARKPGRMLLTSVTDADWEAENGVHPQPWDLGPIQVRNGAGVLGIFDDASLPAAPKLVASAERGIEAVAAVVPYEWSRSVVVYALADPSYLRSIEDVPGGDPDVLDGVAFPVPAAPGDPTPAATRFALNPRMLDRAGPARDRLVRHELTHVALGTRDDAVPVWLCEGLAEYVSVQPMRPAARRVSERAVRAAEQGFEDLPDDASFNGADTDTNYALAWFACEYLARSFDPTVPWTLLDLLGATDTDPGRVLHDQLGLWPGVLARRAGELIVAEYGEPPVETTPEVPVETAPPVTG
jgi:hypothetical protein